MIEILSKLKTERTLISIKRNKIDDLSIHGFLLDYSEELILIAYEYDFILDGLMVLRCSDITEIKTNKTDLLQTEILKEEGLYSKVDFDIACELKGWGGVLSTLGKRHRFVSIEDENNECPLFYIGEIVKIGNDSVSIMEFSGAANWDEDASEIYYEDISCMQFGNNYTNMYERYFERNPLKKPYI